MIICKIHRKNTNGQTKITNEMTYNFSVGGILFLLPNIHFLSLNKLG